ncbi:hypothetical protein LINGRAHAP2_LOCUS18602 [Linum grandiflorum]
MKLVPKKIYSSLSRYWRRKRYQRIHDGAIRNKTARITRLGGHRDNNNNRAGKLVWKIKVVPKLRLRVIVRAPLKLAGKLKNSYLDMMVRIADTVGHSNTDRVLGNKRVPKSRQLGMSDANLDFESRILYEMVKNISASHELSPM